MQYQQVTHNENARNHSSQNDLTPLTSLTATPQRRYCLSSRFIALTASSERPDGYVSALIFGCGSTGGVRLHPVCWVCVTQRENDKENDGKKHPTAETEVRQVRWDGERSSDALQKDAQVQAQRHHF